jgi:hypothetical protein
MINQAAAAYWKPACADHDDPAILIVIGAAPNPV